MKNANELKGVVIYLFGVISGAFSAIILYIGFVYIPYVVRAPKPMTDGTSVNVWVDSQNEAQVASCNGHVNGYALFDEYGTPEFKSEVRKQKIVSEVPKGYILWDPITISWLPNKKTAVKTKDYVFKLKDGSVVRSSDCYSWRPLSDRHLEWLNDQQKDLWFWVMRNVKDTTLIQDIPK